MYSFIISQGNVITVNNFLRQYNTMVYSTTQYNTTQYSNQHDTSLAIRRTVYLFLNRTASFEVSKMVLNWRLYNNVTFCSYIATKKA